MTALIVDALPLQTDHRYRGIGMYTAGLLDALTTEPERLNVPLALLANANDPSDSPLLRTMQARPDVGVVRLRGPRKPYFNRQWVIATVTVSGALALARPRLYHATEPNGLVLSPGVVTVATLYDLIPLRQVDAHFPLRRPDQRLGYGRYLRRLQRTDYIIAISEATKRDAVERLNIPPERIGVTHLAVDESRFQPPPASVIANVAAAYDLRRPYFLHIGASTYTKNTAATLQAFARLCKESSTDHTFYIAGQWNPGAVREVQDTYQALVAAGRIRILGYVPDDDMSALYAGADALLYPSLIEGFGLPVLEAMRCGAPVLTSSTSSLPEVGGDAALYVDPTDIESIAEGLHKIAFDSTLRQLMRERGFQQASRFSYARMADETRAVYKMLL